MYKRKFQEDFFLIFVIPIDNLGKYMVNQSKNKFSMKTKYGAALAPVFLLAGAYVAWNYINHGLWRKKDDKNSRRDIRKRVSEQRRDGNAKNMGKEASSGRDERTLSKSVSMGAIRGGKLALQRLLDLHSYRVDTSSLANAEIEFEALLSKENPDFGLLQVVHIQILFCSFGSNCTSLGS